LKDEPLEEVRVMMPLRVVPAVVRTGVVKKVLELSRYHEATAQNAPPPAAEGPY
jgi:hypothetical protein